MLCCWLELRELQDGLAKNKHEIKHSIPIHKITNRREKNPPNFGNFLISSWLALLTLPRWIHSVSATLTNKKVDLAIVSTGNWHSMLQKRTLSIHQLLIWYYKK